MFYLKLNLFYFRKNFLSQYKIITKAWKYRSFTTSISQPCICRQWRDASDWSRQSTRRTFYLKLYFSSVRQYFLNIKVAAAHFSSPLVLIFYSSDGQKIANYRACRLRKIRPKNGTIFPFVPPSHWPLAVSSSSYPSLSLT